MHFRNSVGADSVLNFSSGFDVVSLLQFSFVIDKDFNGYGGASANIKAYSHGIYTLTWSDAVGWQFRPSKRIKGKRATWIANGQLNFADFDYPANVTQNLYNNILLVTDIID